MTTIGRAKECSVVLSHTSLSRKHAQIENLVDRFVLTDLGSRNGTFVNGNRIDRCELRHGDSVQCGDVVVLFLIGSSQLRQAPPGVKVRSLVEILEDAPIEGASIRLSHRDPAIRVRARLEIMLAVSRLLSSPMPLEALLEKIVDLLLQILAIDRAALLFMSDRLPAPGTAVVGGKLEPLVVKPAGSSATYSRQVVSHVMQSKSAVLSRDAQRDDRFTGDSGSILGQSIRSVMAAPLLARGEIVGVLYVDNVRRTDSFSDEDLEFLAAFGSQASMAIENHELARRLEGEAVRRGAMLRFFPPQAVKRLEETGGLKLGAVETEATLLFSDITGFTEMSSVMAPGDVVSLLNAYFPVMAEIVFKHEGTLEKYIGDALLAVWGAPFKTANDAGNAVRAAVDMLRALKTLNETWARDGRPPIAVHIGVNTGLVAAGNIGSESYVQYATIGDPTNVASRICSAAKAGELLISQGTKQRLGPFELPLLPLPPVPVKGKAEPLTLYQVVWDA